MAAWMDRAKLSFAVSADLLDSFPMLSISNQGRAVLDAFQTQSFTRPYATIL